MPTEPMRNRIELWLRERLPLTGAQRVLSEKTVPTHAHTIWYFLGSVVLLALGVLIGTGMLLVVYYRPSVPATADLPSAHESVRRIVEEIPHGWWIRSIHHWAAHLMIAALLVHLLSTLLMKAYRRPRGFIWWAGLALLGLTLASGFTGYLLPWNGLSFAATRVGAGIAGATPLAGPLIHKLLLAGPDVTELTLTRFFGLHVAVLPLLIAGAVGAHLLLVMCYGSSVPPSVGKTREPGDEAPGVPFWPDFVWREARVQLLVLGGLLIVAFVYPPPLGDRADVLAPTAVGIQPEWYFLSLFKVLKLAPEKVLGLENLQFGAVLMGVLGLVLAAMPLLDDPAPETGRKRRKNRWPGRILLVAGVAIGWGACLLPVRLAIAEYWPDASTVSTASALALALLWAGVGVWVDALGRRRPHAAATLFGVVLVSALVGYTLWEGLGARAGLAGTGVFLGAMLVIRLSADRWPALAKLTAAALAIAALLVVVPLSRGQEQPVPSDPHTKLVTGAVPHAHPSGSTGQFIAALTACAFLLTIVHIQIRRRQRLREMGLYD